MRIDYFYNSSSFTFVVGERQKFEDLTKDVVGVIRLLPGRRVLIDDANPYNRSSVNLVVYEDIKSVEDFAKWVRRVSFKDSDEMHDRAKSGERNHAEILAALENIEEKEIRLCEVLHKFEIYKVESVCGSDCDGATIAEVLPEYRRGLVDEIIYDIEHKKTRSAWQRGAVEYAVELLEDYADKCRYDLNHTLRELTFLNGADSWLDYSKGGNALFSNYDIAKRVCTASEFNKFKEGAKEPTGTTWVDVQGRILSLAWQYIELSFRKLFC